MLTDIFVLMNIFPDHMDSFGIDEAFEILSKTSQDNTLSSIVYEPLKK